MTPEQITDRRIAVRAVIFRDDALLVQHKVYADGTERYALPGGAPNIGETLERGLQRECFEEIGQSVVIVELLHVADYYKPRDTEPRTYRQQTEFLFRCFVPDDYIASNGPKPDKHQVGVHWLPHAEVESSLLFPHGFKALLAPATLDRPVYVGLID